MILFVMRFHILSVGMKIAAPKDCSVYNIFCILFDCAIQFVQT